MTKKDNYCLIWLNLKRGFLMCCYCLRHATRSDFKAYIN